MSKIKFTDKYGPQEVRALSWKQPFASLMLHGKVETRVWPSKYFGWVLICASQAPYSGKQVVEISGTRQSLRISGLFDDIKSLPVGQAIAIGKLKVSRSADTMFYFPAQTESQARSNTAVIPYWEKRCFVEMRSGLWLHEYEDVQPIEPFAWKGQLGFKKLDQETIDKIVLL